MKLKRESSSEHKVQKRESHREGASVDWRSTPVESPYTGIVSTSSALTELKVRRGQEVDFINPVDMSAALTPLRVQRALRLAGGDAAEEDVRRAASTGVQTASSTLPYLDKLQPLFGRHNISHVKAHVGDEAAASAHAMGARAYTTGDHVVFGGTPDVHTAAHEAAHVVQQRGGVHLAGGVGREGDEYERHADAVADRVAAGQSAEELLDQYAGGQGKAPVAGAAPGGGNPHPLTGEHALKETEPGGDRHAIQRKLKSWGFELETPWPTTREMADGSVATNGYKETGWVAEYENAVDWKVGEEANTSRRGRVEIVSRAIEEEPVSELIVSEISKTIPKYPEFQVAKEQGGFRFSAPAGSPGEIPTRAKTADYPGDYRLQVSVKYDKAMKLTDLSLVESKVEKVEEELIAKFKDEISLLTKNYLNVLGESQLAENPSVELADYLAWKTLSHFLTTELAQNSDLKKSSHSKNVFGAMPRDVEGYKEGLKFVKEQKVPEGFAAGVPRIGSAVIGKNTVKISLKVEGKEPQDYVSTGALRMQNVSPLVRACKDYEYKSHEKYKEKDVHDLGDDLDYRYCYNNNLKEGIVYLLKGEAVTSIYRVGTEEATRLDNGAVLYATGGQGKQIASEFPGAKVDSVIQKMCDEMTAAALNAATRLIALTKAVGTKRQGGFHQVAFKEGYSVDKVPEVVKGLVLQLFGRKEESDFFDQQSGQHKHENEQPENKKNLYELRYRPRTPGGTSAITPPNEAIQNASNVIAEMVKEARKEGLEEAKK